MEMNSLEMDSLKMEMNSLEMDSGVEWIHLPPEILEKISNMLIYSDYIDFRAVCRSCRSAVPKIPRHLPSQVPWLMLPLSPPSQCAFFDLSNNKSQVLGLPEASHRKRQFGSSHGWLVVLEETPDVVLVNALTGAKFHLPPLSSFPEVVSFNYSDVGHEYVLQVRGGNSRTRNLKEMRDSFIRKLILSSCPVQNDDFLALALVDQSGNLSFCKNGDTCWTLVDGADSFCLDAVYHNGLFYALDKHGWIAVCDVRSASTPIVSIICSWLPSNDEIQFQERTFSLTLYVVFSGEELLLLTRYRKVEHEEDGVVLCTTTSFDVHRMDWSRGAWTRVESLGDQMLFIGENSSISLSASDFPRCSGGSIYFINDYSDSNYKGDYAKHDAGIFTMWDNTIKPLPYYLKDWFVQLSHRPLWITPNPREIFNVLN